jgi:hypothetical protein
VSAPVTLNSLVSGSASEESGPIGLWLMLGGVAAIIGELGALGVCRDSEQLRAVAARNISNHAFDVSLIASLLRPRTPA